MDSVSETRSEAADHSAIYLGAEKGISSALLHVPETITKPDRLLSLDVMRGLVIVGMIVVNSAAFVKEVDGFDVYPILLHAEWAGFTLADFVFPAFVFMVGVSIAIAPRGEALTGVAFRAIAARSLRLFLAGLVISNLYWAADWDQNGFRVMGVLQRIALCYFASAVLFLVLSARTRLILAMAMLLLYWPLTLAPMPDGHATDLLEAGANFVSWCDRALMGPANFVKGPLGFDPEGLAGTLPAIAQCLLGIAAGECFAAAGAKGRWGARSGAGRGWAGRSRGLAGASSFRWSRRSGPAPTSCFPPGSR